MSVLYSDGWNFIALIRFPWGYKCVLQHHMGWALCFRCAYCHRSHWICTIPLFGCSYPLHSPRMESTSEHPMALQWYTVMRGWDASLAHPSCFTRRKDNWDQCLGFPFYFIFSLLPHGCYVSRWLLMEMGLSENFSKEISPPSEFWDHIIVKLILCWGAGEMV